MKTKTFFSRMAWDTSQLLRKSFTSLKALTLLFAVGLSVNVWGADVTHDFAQSIQQSLNNNANISSINIPEQDYAIKEVRIVCRYNKSIDPAVTISVSVGGTSWGTQTVGNEFNGTKTLSYPEISRHNKSLL